MKGISGRVAIVTGGAGGIGAGLVKAFTAAGAKVVSADILEAQGEALAKEVGANCAFKRTDLRSDADIEQLVAFAIEKFGAIDFLVNSACTRVSSTSGEARAAMISSGVACIVPAMGLGMFALSDMLDGE